MIREKGFTALTVPVMVRESAMRGPDFSGGTRAGVPGW